MEALNDTWLDDNARHLLSFRPGQDRAIELEKDDARRVKHPPHGPLYEMSRDELLVLRKTWTDLLDKG